MILYICSTYIHGRGKSLIYPGPRCMVTRSPISHQCSSFVCCWCSVGRVFGLLSTHRRRRCRAPHLTPTTNKLVKTLIITKKKPEPTPTIDKKSTIMASRNQQPPTPRGRCYFGGAAAATVATAVVLALGASSAQASANVIPPPSSSASSSCVRVTDAAFSPSSCVPGAHEASFVFSMEGVATTRRLPANAGVSTCGGCNRLLRASCISCNGRALLSCGRHR